MLAEMGLDVDHLDPRQLAIYGNSFNGMLPQLNSSSRPDDLTENAITVTGQSDGTFNTNDYLLFYGKSSDHLSYNSTSGQFSFEKNAYSDTSFYFLTIKKDNGKRIPEIAQTIGSETKIKSYKSLHIHELEENTIIDSGREWYGERFTSATKNHTISFSTAGLVSGSDIQIYTSVLSRSTGSSSFDIDINGQALGSIDMLPISSSNPYTTRADVETDTFTVSGSGLNLSEGLNINFTFNENSVNDGYIDYAHVLMEKSLNLNNGPLHWFSSGLSSFEISGASTSTQIWDISDPTAVINTNAQVTDNKAIMASGLDPAAFLAFDVEHFLTPIFKQKLANQNLHGLAAADGIIITHKDFLASAQRLANFRIAHDGLLVEVVSVDQIFNEFGSGSPDPTAIRDFIKVQYDKYSQLKYVLMFGDCSFDYKDRSIEKTNFVPIYESRNSLHPLNSYSSEDYFGFMSDSEGEWIESYDGDHTMELGIGRIPIQSNEEGEAVVNKIIRYHTNKLAYGKWRNKITFIADDGNGNIHELAAELLSKYVDTIQQGLNVDKIYLDAYAQEQNKSPQASGDFLKAISNGNLIVNYTGHGNEGVLTDEDIFTELMISDLSNNLLLPLFVTATCDFGRYDYPNRVTAGEQIVLLPYGGAIALITATRSVIADRNYELNEAFYFSAMEKVDGKLKRLGDIMRETKNNSLAGPSNRNYALIGDPMMRIAFPENQIALTAINNKPISQLDTLNAFGKYTVSGEVQSNGKIDTKFNGVMTLTVYDKPTKFQTRGDEDPKQIYEIRDVLLFQGRATVTEGKFDIEFVVPKNINYSFGEGKLSFYAVNDLSTADASGAFSEVIVGGSEKVTASDQAPPEISIFLNDSTFQTGGTVGPSSMLLVKLEDESGINISNIGFGNELLMYLNENEAIALNEYYEASIDTYQKGWVSYPIDNLETGKYELTIEASDIFNNATSKTIEFFVNESNGIKLTNIINYPNPIEPENKYTTISFDHDRLGEDLKASVTLTDMQGQEVYTETYRFDNVSDKTLQIVWNLDTFGTKGIRKGVYIYRLKVQSQIDGSTGEVFRRMIIMK